jgi:hypothetical protein
VYTALQPIRPTSTLLTAFEVLGPRYSNYGTENKTIPVVYVSYTTGIALHKKSTSSNINQRHHHNRLRQIWYG